MLAVFLLALDLVVVDRVLLSLALGVVLNAVVLFVHMMEYRDNHLGHSHTIDA